MKKTSTILAILLVLLAFTSCHKDKEFGSEKPEISEVEVMPSLNHADFTWKVEYPGKFQTGVEIGDNKDLVDSRIVEGTKNGDLFKASISQLEASTKYYYRIVVWNKMSRQEGEVKSFTTLTYTTDQTFTVNGVSFTMKRVEGGTFWMGAQSTNPNGQNYDSEAYDDRESPVHSVTLSTFYMGETEVTQELWQAVMGSNPSHFSGTNLPVEVVSWNMIVNEFLPALNAATGRNFRLPTEAEWEYAARGGNQGHGYKYAGSNTIGNVAWYTDNSINQTHSVATKSPNELGLYDMSGNEYESCSDWYSNYSSGSQTNPTGPLSDSDRVFRAGS
jgi:formylglycine-generating enzyme required for sulfatase activity